MKNETLRLGKLSQRPSKDATPQTDYPMSYGTTVRRKKSGDLPKEWSTNVLWETSLKLH